MVPLIVAGTALLLIVVIAIGYVAIGYADATTKLNRARDAYNTTVAHQNSLNSAVQSLSGKLPTSNVASASSTDMQQFRTSIDGIATRSKNAQDQIASDDTNLAAAQDQLKTDQWLTAVRRSDLDRANARIGHERKALAYARTITADYVQVGAFFDAFFDMAADFDTLSAKANAGDFSGMTAANEKIKADVAKTIQLDKAPGIPVEMDSFLKDVLALANDITAVINTAASGDSAGLSAAEARGSADSAKLDKYDFNKMGDDVVTYYQPLIDAYNSEVDKANNT